MRYPKHSCQIASRGRALGRCLCTLVIGAVLVSAADAQLPVISLRSLSHSFFAPGETYEVSVSEGHHTDEIRELVFSSPGITATLLNEPSKPITNSDSPRYGHFRLSVSTDVPEGRYEARAVGRFGISNPRGIVIRKDTVWVSNTGADAPDASPVHEDGVYCYRTSPRKRDFYSLPVVAGQEYELTLVAQAVDSRIIGALSVLGTNGQTLHSAIGSEQSDVNLTFVATQSETLIVVVHDALFRGGASYQYGLAIKCGRDRISSELAIEAPKSLSVIQLDAINVDESETPIPLQVPAVVDAAFDSVGDRDQYLFDFSKDTPVEIEIASDRLGQPTDARLVIERAMTEDAGGATWQQVATGEDSQNVGDSVIRLASGDPTLRFQAPADGRYRITVSDLDTGQSLGATQRYRLSVTTPEDQWQLLAYPVYPHKDAKTSQPSGSHLARGQSTVIRVFVIRNGMASPIKVSIVGLPEGLSYRPAWIATNQNQTDLVITTNDHAATQWAPVTIIGEASGGDDRSESREACAACVVWEQSGDRPAAHARLTDRLVLGTSDLDVYPISVHPTSAEILTVKKGSQVKIPLTVQRNDDAKENIVLRAQNVPPGVKVGELTIDKDKDAAEWSIDVTAAAPSGIYTFWGQGETKVKFAVNPQALTRALTHRDELQRLRADPNRSSELAAIDLAIADAEKQLETLKNQTAAKDFTVFVPTSLITLEIQ